MADRFNPLTGRMARQRAAMGELVEELPPSAVAISDDGTIQIGALLLTPLGLRGAAGLSEDDWLRLGGALRKLQTSLQWLIGDWMAYGEREYGKTYEEIAGLLGYEVTTLYDLSYTCRQVKISVRTEKLSFTHHKLVAGLPVDEQRYWLGWAATSTPRPSVAQMRRAMLDLPEPEPSPKGVAKVAAHAADLRAYADKIVAKKLDVTERTQLRLLAEEQAQYWQSIIQKLGE